MAGNAGDQHFKPVPSIGKFIVKDREGAEARKMEGCCGEGVFWNGISDIAGNSEE